MGKAEGKVKTWCCAGKGTQVKQSFRGLGVFLGVLLFVVVVVKIRFGRLVVGWSLTFTELSEHQQKWGSLQLVLVPKHRKVCFIFSCRFGTSLLKKKNSRSLSRFLSQPFFRKVQFCLLDSVPVWLLRINYRSWDAYGGSPWFLRKTRKRIERENVENPRIWQFHLAWAFVSFSFSFAAWTTEIAWTLYLLLWILSSSPYSGQRKVNLAASSWISVCFLSFGVFWCSHNLVT